MKQPERLGPYRLVRELASGGMGCVYEGVHELTGARHALKVLLPDVLGQVSPQELARFQREAEALGQLDHPHVVRIHAADLSGPTPYLAQDLLPGGTLQERLAAGPLATSEAVSLALELASGLAAAHAAGILHRDLKPENVLFDELGEPRLVDFGVALTSGSGTERLTESGSIVGTPNYMAPEQARSERREDERTDVYGLGALLFAMLSGEPPVPSRGTLLATLALVAEGKVTSLHGLRPDLPADLVAVVMRALATRPDQRFRDVDAFADALRSPPLPPARRGLSAGIGAALVLLLMAGLVYVFPTGSAPAPSPVDPPPADPLAETERQALEALQAGDGAKALPLVERMLAAGPSATWQRRRGLAHLLRADPQAASADLEDDRQGMAAARAEEQRLELAAASAELHGLVLVEGERYDELLALGERLIEDGRALRELDMVGPPLTRRLCDTLIAAVLNMPQPALEAREARALSVLQRASAIAAPGDLGPRIARALILQEFHDDHQNLGRHPLLKEIPEVLELAAREGDPPRWSLTLWGMRTDLLPGDGTQRLEPLPEQPPEALAALTDLEHTLLRSVYLRPASAALSLLERSLREDPPPQDCLAHWEHLLEAIRRHVYHASRRSLESAHMALLRQASIYLLAQRVPPALEILRRREAWANKYYAQRKVLLLECELLQGADPVAGVEALDALVAEHGTWRELYALRAAYRAARGDDDAARADLRAAREAKDSLRDLRLPWRTAEETERELRGAGLRKALVRLLANAPGPRPRPR